MVRRGDDKGVDAARVGHDLIVGKASDRLSLLIVVEAKAEKACFREGSVDAQRDVGMLIDAPGIFPVVDIEVWIGEDGTVATHQCLSPLFFRGGIDNRSNRVVVV